MSQPDLARTKLCKTLIGTGQCTDPECRYAHSKEELRLVLGFNCANGGNSNGCAAAMAPSPPVAQVASGSPTSPATTPPTGQESSSLQHVAMQQLAEAAQAHVAEAMRLQAMAACLQAQGSAAAAPPFPSGAGISPQFPGAFVAPPQGCGFPGAAPFPAVAPMSPGAGATGPAPGRAQKGRGDKGRGKGRGVGQAAKDKSDPTGHFARAGGGAGAMFRAQAPMDSPSGPFPLMGSGLLSQGWEEADHNSLTMSVMQSPDAFEPSEPAQIHPLSLRSLSNCSLVDLAKAGHEAESDSQGPQQSGTQPLAGGQGFADMSSTDSLSLGWTVKNTFLDFEVAPSPTVGRLRPICSAAGRLNALAEGSTTTTPELGPQDEPHEDVARGVGRPLQPLPPAHGDSRTSGPSSWTSQQPSVLAEKRAQDTPLAVGQAPPRAAAVTTAPQWPADQLAGHAAACGTGPARTSSGATADAGAASGTTAVAGATQSPQPDAGTEAGDSHGEPSESSSSPKHASAGESGLCGGAPGVAQPSAVLSPRRAAPLLAEGITVKNTFLDFAMPEPATLRAVQTAAGRLVDLGHEDDDED